MSRTSRIRVLLADDHLIVRAGLASLLANQPEMIVVGEADTGQQTLELIEPLQPDIIVMDIAMPGLNGIETTRRIKEAKYRCQIIILSMHQTKEYISQALRAGAMGYLIKSNAASVLIEAIQQVYQGKSYLAAEISQTVIDDYVRHSDKLESMQGQGSPLSSREREILQLIAEGNSSKEIANQLKLSLKTIENHRRNIMQKLDIHTTAGLVQYAIRHKILPME